MAPVEDDHPDESAWVAARLADPPRGSDEDEAALQELGEDVEAPPAEEGEPPGSREGIPKPMRGESL